MGFGSPKMVANDGARLMAFGMNLASMGTMFGAKGAATGAAKGGLFSGSNLFTMMSGAGMGMGAAQAFSSSGGFAPTFKVNLSPEGQKLQKTLYETTKKQYETGLLPANLASIYIGGIKRQAGEGRRMIRGMLASGKKIRTGRDIGAAITGAKETMEGQVAPAQWKKGFRENEFRSALASMQNIRNIELQTPVLKAQTAFTKGLTGQMRSAAQGQALGDIARWLAMVKYPL